MKKFHRIKWLSYKSPSFARNASVPQDMLLRLALQAAHDDYQDRRQRQCRGIEIAKQNGKYQGRAPDLEMHKRVIALRKGGESIAITAKLAKCSEAQVKRIWRAHLQEGQ